MTALNVIAVELIDVAPAGIVMVDQLPYELSDEWEEFL